MQSNNQPPKEEKIIITYPKRPNRDPDKDRSYRKAKVLCNLKQINLGLESTKVTQYAIHYEPIISDDNYPLKRKLIRELRKDLNGYFGKFAQAGDTLFVFGKDSQEKVSLETKVDEVLYKITFDKTPNVINCRNINKKTADNIKIRNFLETIVKNLFMANNHMVRFDDRSFYDYNSASSFGRSGAKIWAGYSTAVTITENGLFLRLNEKNKLITGKSAYEKMVEIGRRYGNNLRSEESQREINEYFRGKTVIATYGNYRAYRIGEVSFDRNIDNLEFEIEKEGKKSKINIKNYYKQQYKIDIKNTDQPLLIEEIPRRRANNPDSAPVKRYLIPELVYLTGIDELDEKDRAEIIAKSKFNPNEKIKRIEKGFSYLTNKAKKKIKKKDKDVELHSPDEIRKEWGINFGESFVEVEAQFLPLPRLQFGDGNKDIQLRNGRFKQLRDFNPISFDSNNCMLITFDNLVDLAKGDCSQMSRAGENLGVKFSRPSLHRISNTRHDDLLNELKKINYNDGKIIVIVVLDKSTKNLYPYIKDFLYTQAGLTSQFMLHDENPRGGGRKKQNLSYYSAVLNQMVVKSHGELFRMDFSEKITKEPSMIIGIDSTKTKEGMKYILSASFNRFFNKFYTDIKVDKENDSALINLIKSAIDYFKNVNKNIKPTSIIIYRQGGNEKQTERLMRNELPKILKLFGGEDEGYEKDYKPKLSIFSVNKKTELKFFERHNGVYKNLPSGTVIDREVISPELFEFYLQCPEVERGTGSPVHFLCIYNNNESLTINDFEEITYKQSFYYWNWCGPIRIPAALKYAEVANTFCGKNIKGEVLGKLKDSPYFI